MRHYKIVPIVLSVVFAASSATVVKAANGDEIDKTGVVLGDTLNTDDTHSLITDIQKPEPIVIERYRWRNYYEEGEWYLDYFDLDMTWDNGEVTKETVKYDGTVKKGDNYIDPDFSSLTYKYPELDKLFDKDETEYDAQKKVTVIVHEVVDIIIEEPEKTVFETAQDARDYDWNIKRTLVYDDGTESEDYRDEFYLVEENGKKGERKVLICVGEDEEIETIGSFIIKINNDYEFLENSLEITKLPDKLEYYEGEEVDFTGGRVLYYDRTDRNEITLWMEDMDIGDYDKTEGVQTVPLYYEFLDDEVLSVSFDVTYKKKDMEETDPMEDTDPIEDTDTSEETDPVVDTDPSDGEDTSEETDPSEENEPTEDTNPKEDNDPTGSTDPSEKNDPTADTDSKDETVSTGDTDPDKDAGEDENTNKQTNTSGNNKPNGIDSSGSSINRTVIAGNMASGTRPDTKITGQSTITSSPQTGDKNIWLTIAGASAAALGAAVVVNRKKKSN